LDRRLDGPQRWSGHRLEEEPFASARDRTPIVQSVLRHYYHYYNYHQYYYYYFSFSLPPSSYCFL
jgi:hypothetical protein